MTSSARMRRYRVAIAGTLVLAMLGGCFTPTTPGATGGGDRRTTGGSIGAGSAAKGAGDGGAVVAIAGGAASGQTGALVGTNSSQSGQATSPARDLSGLIVGRVLVPPGILSNNGGNVIGQNGGNVIGQNGGNIISNNGGSVIGQNGGNVIGQNGGNVIGQNGGNVVGQNGGNVIGQNGGNVIGQNGGNVIGQNGGNIISNNGGSFRLNQRPLAYASIQVVDASGKPRLDKAGKEIVVQADEQGQFELPREAVTEHSILRATSPAVQGELRAFVARQGQGIQQVDVDAVTTLTSTYILEKYVNSKQNVLDRLTSEIEAEAQEDVVKALEVTGEAAVSDLAPVALVRSLDRLIGVDSGVADVFKRIEKLLVIAGIVNDGDGLLATEVPFDDATGILATAEGTYIFNPAEHRLRLVMPDGRIRNVVSPNSWPYSFKRPTTMPPTELSGMAISNGWLYLSDTYNHRIVRIKDGAVEVVAGSGIPGYSPDGLPGPVSTINLPTGLAVAPDGTVVFSDSGNGLVRRITSRGDMETVAGGGYEVEGLSPISPLEIRLSEPQGLTFDPTGSLYIADRGNAVIRVLKGDSNLMERVYQGVKVSRPQGLSHAGGSLYATGTDGLYRVSESDFTEVDPREDSTGGALPWTRAGTPVSELSGMLYLQLLDRLVVSLNPDAYASLREIAGVRSVDSRATFRSAVKFDFNGRGDLVAADSTNMQVFHMKKGGELKLIAGSGKEGFAPDVSDPLGVPFGVIRDVAWEGDDTILIATGGDYPAIYRVSVGGAIKLVAGIGKVLELGDSRKLPVSAKSMSLFGPHDLVPLPDGRLLFFEQGLPLVLNQNGVVDEFDDLRAVPATSDMGYGFAVRVSDGYILVDNASLDVVHVSGGQKSTLFSGNRVRDIFRGDAIRGVAVDFRRRLYIGGSDHLIQVDTTTGRVRSLLDVGGVIDLGGERDETIIQLRDLKVTESGDLLVLDLGQVKQLPSALLAFP